MEPFSSGINGVARNSHRAILRALSSVGQKPTADALGTSEATISRWKSEQSQFVAILLSAIGLKVVPSEESTVPAGFEVVNPEVMRSLRVLARRGIEKQPDDEVPTGNDI